MVTSVSSAMECLKPTNYSKHIMPELVSADLGFIPQILMICSLVMVCSLAIYIVAHFTNWLASDIIEGEKPWLYELLLMKKDQWLMKTRGKSALEYIQFQRTIILLAITMVVISSVSIGINLSQGNNFQLICSISLIMALIIGDWHPVTGFPILPS